MQGLCLTHSASQVLTKLENIGQKDLKGSHLGKMETLGLGEPREKQGPCGRLPPYMGK